MRFRIFARRKKMKFSYSLHRLLFTSNDVSKCLCRNFRILQDAKISNYALVLTSSTIELAPPFITKKVETCNEIYSVNENNVRTLGLTFPFLRR